MSSTGDVEPAQDPESRPAAGAKLGFRLWRRPIATAENIRDRRYKKWAELGATIILALATLASAWAGYEAGKWNGVQTLLNLQATILRIESGQLTAKSHENLLVDLQLTTNWVNAINNGDKRLADFYRARVRDEFRPAFDAWLATRPLENPNAPESPFDMAEYRLAARDEAEAMGEEAGKLSLSAEVAGSIADQYTLSIVILAGALLLAGMAHRFEWVELRIAVVAVALLVLLFSIINIVRLPIV